MVATKAGLTPAATVLHDAALASSSYSLHSLLAFADPTHITFGCDWPHATMERPRTLRHCWMNSR